MKKVRAILAVIALIVTLSGVSLQGMGASSLANATSRWHISAPSASVQLSKPLAYRPYGPCPYGTASDC